MATAALRIPGTQIQQGAQAIPTARLPAAAGPSETQNVSPDAVIKEWLDRFHQALKSQDLKRGLATVFLKDETYWRDQLCLSWDFHTLKQIDTIANFLSSKATRSRLPSLSLSVDDSNATRKPTLAPIDAYGKSNCISSFLNVKTDVGQGQGIIRLCKEASSGQWKAFTLLTSLFELKGREEAVGIHRPNGVQHGGMPGRKNWQERRAADAEYQNGRSPAVLIIGSGQAGLTVAARLKLMGVDALMIDKNPRIGDNWRNRYHQLVLHDPVWYDHLPYIPFPSFWPKFVPKDKLGDWFESYASALELNAWMSTSPKSCKYDDKTKKWTVILDRTKDGKQEQRTLHPRFIIQATGASGEKKIPSSIKGLDTFKGSVICHSSEFPGARPNSKGRRAVIVGCCNSGHDIAQDFVENGYEVTLVQRSSTCVVTSEAAMEFYLGALYSEDGPATEDSDLLFASLPSSVLKRVHIDLTSEIGKKDTAIHAGLKKRGFALDSGPDGAGLFLKYLSRGGGYYIDVGASQLIIDGRIKVKQGVAVKGVEAQGLRMADNSLVAADEIVFATGYGNMRETCERILGRENAARVKQDVWGFDREGELRTIWRPSGHPGLMFMGGNLALCRYYSKLVAVQIKAILEGINRDPPGGGPGSAPSSRDSSPRHGAPRDGSPRGTTRREGSRGPIPHREGERK